METKSPATSQTMEEHALDFSAKLLRACSDEELAENRETYARLANVSKLHADVFELADEELKRRKNNRRP